MTTILDRFTIAGIAGAGLCAVAVALTPTATAVPFVAGGGYACVENSAGAAAPAGAAGAPCAATVAQAAAPIVPAAGPIVPVVPVAPPPIIPPVPVAPPVPVVPPVPVAPIIPAAAPIGGAGAAGAPLVEMGGVAGKGDPVGTPPGTDGVPTLPGPQG